MAALAGVAAIAMYSCARDEVRPAAEEQPESRIATVHFTASQAAGKAAFGEAVDGIRPTLWTANDSEVKLSLNYGSTLEAGVTPSQDYGSASFSAEIDFTGLTPPYTYYVVSPASVAKALSPSREAWKVSIPCEQTPSATSPDEQGVILAAQSNPYMSQTGAADVDLYFNHLTAYGRMSLANFNPGEATVQKVELTATTPFVGDWYWKCAATDGEHELIDYGASSTLTINTSSTSDIWFACAPVDMSGQMMVVTVYTSESCFEQMVEFPANRKFEAGAAAVFSIDMTGADEYNIGAGSGTPSGDFTLVEDASTLAAGDELLIVYTTGSLAMGGINTSGNFRDPVSISISDNTISSVGDATILTLETGSESGTWALKDGSSYLACPSSGTKNTLLSSSTVDEYSSWNINVNSKGITSVIGYSGARTHLRYNSQNPRFSCYVDDAVSGTNAVSIFRRSASSGGGSIAADPLLEHSNYGCYLGGSLDREYNPGTDQIMRSYNASGVQTYTIINPDSVEELEISGYSKDKIKGDAVSVSVNWRTGTSNKHSGSYNMKVLKEDGPKVWLGNGSGKGFIIKK